MKTNGKQVLADTSRMWLSERAPREIATKIIFILYFVIRANQLKADDKRTERYFFTLSSIHFSSCPFSSARFYLIQRAICHPAAHIAAGPFKYEQCMKICSFTNTNGGDAPTHFQIKTFQDLLHTCK